MGSRAIAEATRQAVLYGDWTVAPFYVPQEFFDLYDPATFKAPDINEDDLNDILVKGTQRPKHKPSPDYLWLKQNGLIDECARAYAAASSYADACLGVIFEQLARSQFANNTIVVLWGDHGWHLGEKLRYRKATGWHESTRVPLIVRTPGMKDRRDSIRAVNLIDFYPTLIELCGLPTFAYADAKQVGQGNEVWEGVLGGMDRLLKSHGLDIESSDIKLSPLLTIDPKTEQFVGNNAEAANQFLKREYRKGYEVPEIVSS